MNTVSLGFGSLATLAAVLTLACLGGSGGAAAADDAAGTGDGDGRTGAPAGDRARLTPPAEGPIPVAVLLSDGATVIDFAGPWEVFQDVEAPGGGPAFELYTVAASREPIRASAGLVIVPDHTFADAPQPRVIVIPAQRGADGLEEWLQKAAAEADLTMSVCTGAFILARAGLLDGKTATTHHDFFDRFEERFPRVRLSRDVRWVEGPRIATAGGLTSGIDLALRVVARYFGDDTAARTAEYMEYKSDGWRAAAGLWDGGEGTAPAVRTAG